MKIEDILRLKIRRIISENFDGGEMLTKSLETINNLLANIASADEFSIVRPGTTEVLDSYLEVRYGQDGSSYLSKAVGESRYSTSTESFSFDLSLMFSSFNFKLDLFGGGTLKLEREQDDGEVSVEIMEFGISQIALQEKNQETGKWQAIIDGISPEQTDISIFEKAREYIITLIEQNIHYDG